jgi:hypothetical protein
MRRVIEAMGRAGRLANAAQEEWEDRLIAAWRHLRGRVGRA